MPVFAVDAFAQTAPPGELVLMAEISLPP